MSWSLPGWATKGAWGVEGTPPNAQPALKSAMATASCKMPEETRSRILADSSQDRSRVGVEMANLKLPLFFAKLATAGACSATLLYANNVCSFVSLTLIGILIPDLVAQSIHCPRRWGSFEFQFQLLTLSSHFGVICCVTPPNDSARGHRKCGRLRSPLDQGKIC